MQKEEEKKKNSGSALDVLAFCLLPFAFLAPEIEPDADHGAARIDERCRLGEARAE